MPASYLMSWEPTRRRWWKMYRGKRYVVSCRQLVVAETKEQSYQAANAWWREKLAELGHGETPHHRYGGVLEKLEFRRDWCRRNNRPEEAALWDGRIKELLSHPSRADPDFDPSVYMLAPDIRDRIKAIELYGGSIAPDLDPLSAEYQFGDGRVWDAREYAERLDRVPEGEAIGGLCRRYLEGFSLRKKAGDLSPGEYALMERCVLYFRDWAGPTSPPSTLTSRRWEDYWKHLLRKTTLAEGAFSPVYAEKYFKYARRFVRWLSDMGINPAPPNLASKTHRFDTTPGPIVTFTVDEAKKLVAAAAGQLKLHLLLMLNCGFNQGDIACLLKSEVDLEAGTITRQRTKTRRKHAKSVPTVTWTLWRPTLHLLRVHLSPHPTLALTTMTGRPWVERGYDDAEGKATSRDAIQSNFRHIQQRLKITKPLKVFRKTSRSMLDRHPEFGRYAQFFLGQAPDSVAASHYVQPSQEQFDAAVAWLGEQFGVGSEVQ